MGALKRAKEARRTLRLFRLGFGVTPPFSVLLDGNALHASLSAKIDLTHRLKKVLQGQAFSLYVPECVLRELRDLGERTAAALAFAEQHCQVVATGGQPEAGGDSNVSDGISALVGTRASMGSRDGLARGRAR